LFRPYLDENFLKEKIKSAHRCSPILMPTPHATNNLYIILEDPDSEKYNLELDYQWSLTGNPDLYLESTIQDIIDKKRRSNDLINSRPNLLVVNCLLGTDFQLATRLRKVPIQESYNPFDGLLITACGIDEIPSLEKSLIYLSANHPLRKIMNNYNLAT
jgi:hypothetical protein